MARKQLPHDCCKKGPSSEKPDGTDCLAQANPDKASAGTAGVAGIFHLAGILFQNIKGTRFQLVPYRGIALAMQDLVAGQIDLIFADTSAIVQVQAGTIKAFAVAAKSRFP